MNGWYDSMTMWELEGEVWMTYGESGGLEDFQDRAQKGTNNWVRLKRMIGGSRLVESG